MNLASKVCYITVGQIRKAVILCIVAQSCLKLRARFGTIVWGQSGIGKNGTTDDLHEEISKQTKKVWNLIDCNLSAQEPTDITGLPRITKEGQTVDCPRYRFEKNSYGIFRLDELDRPAYRQNLVSMVKFAIDKTVEHPLPDNWFVLGLANGASDEGTHPLTEHIRGRFCHLYVSMNSSRAKKEMSDYYDSAGVPDAVKRLSNLRPIETRDEFEEHAVDNNRSRERAGGVLKAYDTLKEQGADFSDVLLPVLAGIVGRQCAVELMKLHSMTDLPTLEAVCNDPLNSIMPDDLSLRHRYLEVLVHEASEDCHKAAILVSYLVRYPDEIARFAIDKLVLSCPDIAKTETYVKWLKRTR